MNRLFLAHSRYSAPRARAALDRLRISTSLTTSRTPPTMIATAANSAKTVGAYEAKSKLSELLDQVERGRTITITRHARNVARLVPATEATVDRSVFTRIRALHARLALGKGESTRNLINAGRRI